MPKFITSYFFDEVILLFEYFFIFVATEGKFFEGFDKVLSDDKIPLFIIDTIFPIEIGCDLVIILL